MKIKLIVIGKTSSTFIADAIHLYEKRLKRYMNLEYLIILDVKAKNKNDLEEQKKKEGEKLLKAIKKTDFVVLLDERGKTFSSEEFAGWMQHRLANVSANIVFVAGGAFGFSNDMYERADFLLSLSKMTFSHEMIRMIFLEQLYRAFTIIKGEPYHYA